MSPEDAIGAAVLGFSEADEALPLRERIRSAIEHYEQVVARCPACRGTGALRVGDSTVYVSKQYGGGAETEPVARGDDIECVVCAGDGVDPDHVAWLCYGRDPRCSPTSESDKLHTRCGFARRLVVDPKVTAGNSSE